MPEVGAGAATPIAMSHDREFGQCYWLRGVLRRRIGAALVRLKFPRATFGQHCDVRSGAHIAIARGASFTVGAGCVLDHGFVAEVRGQTTIGDGTIFGHHSTVASQEAVTIGRDCLIAELVSIRDHDHAFGSSELPIKAQGRQSAPVVIGDNVWIGAKATVMRGVTIGDGAVIGANAVVTRDVPAGAVAVGVPARVVRSRDETPE